MCSYCSQRGFGDEAQVCRAWGRLLGFGLKLPTQLVKVKLLLSESKSLTVSLENAEMIGVECCMESGALGWHVIKACHLVDGLPNQNNKSISNYIDCVYNAHMSIRLLSLLNNSYAILKDPHQLKKSIFRVSNVECLRLTLQSNVCASLAVSTFIV